MLPNEDSKQTAPWQHPWDWHWPWDCKSWPMSLLQGQNSWTTPQVARPNAAEVRSEGLCQSEHARAPATQCLDSNTKGGWLWALPTWGAESVCEAVGGCHWIFCLPLLSRPPLGCSGPRMAAGADPEPIMACSSALYTVQVRCPCMLTLALLPRHQQRAVLLSVHLSLRWTCLQTWNTQNALAWVQCLSKGAAAEQTAEGAAAATHKLQQLKCSALTTAGSHP